MSHSPLPINFVQHLCCGEVLGTNLILCLYPTCIGSLDNSHRRSLSVANEFENQIGINSPTFLSSIQASIPFNLVGCEVRDQFVTPRQPMPSAHIQICRYAKVNKTASVKESASPSKHHSQCFDHYQPGPAHNTPTPMTNHVHRHYWVFLFSRSCYIFTSALLIPVCAATRSCVLACLYCRLHIGLFNGLEYYSRPDLKYRHRT